MNIVPSRIIRELQAREKSTAEMVAGIDAKLKQCNIARDQRIAALARLRAEIAAIENPQT